MLRKIQLGFPWGPVAKTPLPMQRAQVPLLVRERDPTKSSIAATKTWCSQINNFFKKVFNCSPESEWLSCIQTFKLVPVDYSLAPKSHATALKVLVLKQVAQGKESTSQWRRHRRPGFDPWVRKIPWRRAWQPTPVFLPGEPMDRGGWHTTVQLFGRKELDTTGTTEHLHTWSL